MAFRPDGVVIHEELVTHYARIESAATLRKQPEAAIWKGFMTAITRLKQDGHWGEVIPQDRIPSYFKGRYHAKNLYCIDLADFHRAFYMIFEHTVVFLDLVDHRQYDKWFPNKGK